MYSKYFKRVIDFFFSIFLIALFSPIMIVLAILIRRDGGKAIFTQIRSGKGENTFKLYKFRSMISGNNVRDFKREDQITNVGKFIRKTSLDELPQLFNILKGDMSFIGPRPWIIDYSIYFTKNQRKRLEVLPGITGLAQCSGRNDISIKEKINLDIKYVELLSFKMDMYVFIKSVKAVLIKEGTVSSKFLIQKELEELKNQFAASDIKEGILVLK